MRAMMNLLVVVNLSTRQLPNDIYDNDMIYETIYKGLMNKIGAGQVTIHYQSKTCDLRLVTCAFMGPVGEFCYFCVEWVVHGPSAENLLQYCLRALLWEYVMALINYDHSEAACGECVTWCIT